MDVVRDCLGFSIASAHRRLDRLFNRAYQKLKISHAHGQILACLLDEPGLRLADVAARTGLEASTVSRLCKELSRRKLIRRSRHPDDGRAFLLAPARRGEALRAEIEAIHARINADLARELTETDLEGYRHTAAAVHRLP